ncbi:MAG: polysaccharide deacetylase family protein [Sedimenticola sp.]
MSKAVMYHYVRHSDPDLPFFRYLSLDNFKRQLDWFAQRYGFPTRDEFLQSISCGKPWKGVVLTFDDGFSDHYDHVLPALKERGLWGLFFVATAPYGKKKLLEVHRVHMILGRIGGVRAMELLASMLKDEMLSDASVIDFRKKTYLNQENDEATREFKRILNYYVSYDFREEIIGRLMKRVFDIDEADLAQQFYMTPSQLRSMHEDGMLIGSHGANHLLFSKLSRPEQNREIAESIEFLENATDHPVSFFCYPYGGFHSFSELTEELLTENNILASFNVEARDITNEDLQSRPQALPRYDCNQFPYGTADLG